jgi:energy-coupling factor transporter ATP-binding protein EcfA2
MGPSDTSHHIKSISVTKLFGRYSYLFPANGQTLSELNILYGENGAGKTTVLNLVFHLLSPHDNRGHRSKIARIPFEFLKVELNDGSLLTAKKDPQLLVGPVHFVLESPSSQPVAWLFNPAQESSITPENLPQHIDMAKLPKSVRTDVARALDQRNFFQAISKLRIVTYMLTSDRILLGDVVKESTSQGRIDDRSRVRLSDLVSHFRVVSVEEALSTASNWLTSKYLDTNYGNQSTSSLYEDVAKKIAKTTYRTKAGLNKAQEGKLIASLRNAIVDLNKSSEDLAKFGFAGTVISTDVVSAIESSHGNRLHLLSSILEPYLAGLKARLDNTTPLYTLINNFVANVNKFFTDKKIYYSIRHGFKIFLNTAAPELSTKEISPAQLSSGEQQLILLFCHVLVARDSSSVFIIDEPEISLNIVWQRMLITSLQELAKASGIQFIFASHSMEILSKHRHRVISMQEKEIG